jgi:acyl-CoA reductase-like NAD-dependent aldehyde dehydrogenase
MTREFEFILAGRPARSPAPAPITCPYDDAVIATTWWASAEDLERATRAAVEAAPAMRALPAYRRAEILRAVASSLRADRDDVAWTLAGEVGKPIRDARTEVDRAVTTFEVAAEEARRLGGEVIPMDLAPHGAGRVALSRRFPIGPIAAISPFNFPLNLSAHKLAPAIAAGNPIVLKPASKTPISAVRLGHYLVQAGLPEGALSVLPLSRQYGDRMVGDDRFKLLTFTGSSAVGWDMKRRAGRKRVLLELGGNAGVIVDETADVDLAVARVAAGGFALAGQSCISVQRVLVQERVFGQFAAALAERVSRLKVGHPLDPETELGPMVDKGEVDRVDAWVREALEAGGRVLAGGRKVSDAVYAPTILADVPETARVCADEVFAPVVVLASFGPFEDAVAAVNRSVFGLQAGVFTNDLNRALSAYEAIETGGVIVNDVPTWRIDHMPYGGVKESGLGREGPRYSIEEMTELKLLVINRP